MEQLNWSELRNMSPTQLETLGFRRWDSGEAILMLIPANLREQIPLNFELESIMGETILANVKAKSGPGYVDDDTRGELLAYGIRVRK